MARTLNSVERENARTLNSVKRLRAENAMSPGEDERRGPGGPPRRGGPTGPAQRRFACTVDH